MRAFLTKISIIRVVMNIDDFDTQIQCEENIVDDFYGIVRVSDEEIQEVEERQ